MATNRRKKAEPEWYPGDLVIDANENVARKGENAGWFIFGWTDDEWPDEYMAKPLRRLVPVAADAPWLYRITYNNGKIKHGHRRVLGPVLGAMRSNYGHKTPVKIERCPEPEWEDVTSEHIKD